VAQPQRIIAIDTNLLIYAQRSDTSEHQRSVDALRKAADDASGWRISLPVHAEFWSVVTNPRAFKSPSTAAAAASFIHSLVRDAELRIWIPAEGFAQRLLEAAVNLTVTRAKIFDLQIGLIAQDNGAREIWTHDLNFTAIPGIKIHDPL
jgi:predicted nucleic acid-binding protein